MLDAAPQLEKRYPSQWKGKQHIDRALVQCLLSVSIVVIAEPFFTTADDQEELCSEYASYFKGKAMEELDDLARSFSLGEWT